MTFFPRPGFRLDGLLFHPDDTFSIGAETAFLFPDIGPLFSRTPFPLTGKLILKQSTLVSTAPSPATDRPRPLESLLNGSTLKTLTLHFSYTSLQNFALSVIGSHLRISPEKQSKQHLYARSLQGNIKKSPGTLSIRLDPTEFDTPAMRLGGDFYRDTLSHTSQLSVNGHHVPILPLRTMAATFLKKSTIAKILFRIVRDGTLPHITVNFQNSDDQFLFDPHKMTINAALQGGTIAIPSTPLIATDVTAVVQVKNGILSPRISRGMVEEAQLKKGTLQVNLLDKHHEFKGEFFLNANLKKLPGVLKTLLPGTLLSRELDLTEKIAGSTTGTLKLSKTGKKLKVTVHCKDIHLTGTYQRFPGNTFQLQATAFSFDKNKITLQGVKGTIGPIQMSQVSGEIDLKAPHSFNISSDRGRFPIQKTLDWLTQFHPMRPRVAPFSTARGNVTLDHMILKGALYTPDLWEYAVHGTCSQVSLYQDPETKGISDISFSFDLFPHGFKLGNIKATLHDMNGVLKSSLSTGFSPPQRQLFRDLKFPVTLTGATLQKTDQNISFQGQATFPKGISMAMAGTDKNQQIILEKLKIKQPPLSQAQILHPPGSPLIFKGELNIKTIRDLFAQKSSTAAALTFLKNLGRCVLVSGPKKGITLYLDRLDLNTVLSCAAIMENKNTHPEADLHILENDHGHTLQNEVENPQLLEKTLKSKENTMDVNKAHGGASPYVKIIPRPMHVHVTTFSFKRLHISPLNMELFPRTTGTDVEIHKSTCCGLPITGLLQKEAKTLTLTLNTDAQNLDFTTTLECFIKAHHPIEGKFALKAKLFSISRGDVPPQDQLISGFQGPFELYAQNGRIFEMTLLSRILSLINVSKLLKLKLPDLVQHGFAYDTMLLNGEVKKSRIFIQKGVIKGVDMTLIITGWIDPMEKTMDLLCFVSPLKSVDDLIEKLPIINTMFQGNLVSFPITVKGDLHHPDVMALSPVEVTKGIFNTLKDILMTPMTLLKKLP